MFDEVLDLPAHPLFVHLPIVLIPLLIATSVVYAVLPRVRPYVEWAVVGLAVVTPVVTWVARESGYELKDRLAENTVDGVLPEAIAADIDEHARLSFILIWLVAALAVATLVLVVESRREPERLVTVIGAVIVIALSVAAGWYLFKTGDLGAEMVWGGT